MEISQKIIDYAIWYYLRYYPSPNKLRFKLKLKFWPESEKGKKYWGILEEEIEYILTEKLRNIIQEEEVIQSKIRVYKKKINARDKRRWVFMLTKKGENTFKIIETKRSSGKLLDVFTKTTKKDLLIFRQVLDEMSEVLNNNSKKYD